MLFLSPHSSSYALFKSYRVHNNILYRYNNTDELKPQQKTQGGGSGPRAGSGNLLQAITGALAVEQAQSPGCQDAFTQCPLFVLLYLFIGLVGLFLKSGLSCGGSKDNWQRLLAALQVSFHTPSWYGVPVKDGREIMTIVIKLMGNAEQFA